MKPKEKPPRKNNHFTNPTGSTASDRMSIYPTSLGFLQIGTTYTSRYIEVKQRTPGILPAVSRDVWAGYVSPSGGYVNYGTFQVAGINATTAMYCAKEE